MLPSASITTALLTTALVGNYTTFNSKDLLLKELGDVFNNDYNITVPGSYGPGTLYPGTGGLLPEVEMNTWMLALHQWNLRFPNGRNYTPQAGILGLGPMDGTSSDPSRSLLKQLKANGTIASEFCGLHLGSVLLKQQGSMLLGGYEQNRVLGTVGCFNLSTALSIGDGVGPQGFLLDVILGVETGASPFKESNDISLWHGIDNNGDNSDSSAVFYGGRSGSRIIAIDPIRPYMYLPLGICETAAQYLPVDWDEDLELYIWNQNNDYFRIVGSPAFMAFILADSQARNITIKVPFQLLNLTLSQPIVDTPVQYFPCKPFNVTDLGKAFVLGRAFLQAAFVGFDIEHDQLFIAQAPGPDMEQRFFKTFRPNHTTVTPNSLGTFASSWASTWKVLDSNDSTSTISSNKTIVPSSTITIATSSANPMSNNTTAASPNREGGLPKDVAAGVVVGSVLGALAIATFAMMVWRKKMRGKTTVARTKDMISTPSLRDNINSNTETSAELANVVNPAEATGNALPHEMAVMEIHEAPNQRSHQELPVGNFF